MFEAKEYIVYIFMGVVGIAYFWMKKIEAQSAQSREVDRDLYEKLTEQGKSIAYNEGYRDAKKEK